MMVGNLSYLFPCWPTKIKAETWQIWAMPHKNRYVTLNRMSHDQMIDFLDWLHQQGGNPCFKLAASGVIKHAGKSP